MLPGASLFGLWSTTVLLRMAWTNVSQTAVMWAFFWAVICAINHFCLLDLGGVASFAAGVGWLIVAFLTLRLALPPSLAIASTSTDANGLAVVAIESAQSKGKCNLNEQSSSYDLLETV